MGGTPLWVWATFGAMVASLLAADFIANRGELSLSLDNLFVFLLIFQSLGVPRCFQRRVLFWGVMGAIVFRALFIFVGAAAFNRWSWITWVFSATLLYAAWRAFRQNPAESRRSPVVDWLARRFPVT